MQRAPDEVVTIVSIMSGHVTSQPQEQGFCLSQTFDSRQCAVRVKNELTDIKGW